MAAWNRKIDRWSLSAYKQWKECPAKYAYQRFDRLKTPPVPALERGTKLHALAEGYVKGDINVLPKELRNFKTEFASIKKKKYEAEANWAVTVDWEPCDWDAWDVNWCLGKTDAHKYFPKVKELDIIDYKSGRIYPDHELGAEIYSCLGTAYYPDVEIVEVEFWYLDQGKGEIGKSPFVYERDEIEKLREKWERKAYRMMRTKNFRPTPGRWACRFCPFRSDKKLADGTRGPCEEWKKVS